MQHEWHAPPRCVSIGNALVDEGSQQRDVSEILVVQSVVLIEERAEAGHGLQIAAARGAHETIAQREEEGVRQHSV